jgi:hypothetical protein
MPWYLTEYANGYSSQVWGRSWSHARRIAKRRGLGETVMGLWSNMPNPRGTATMPASAHFRRRSPTKRQALDAIHALTFLCQLAIAGGLLKAGDVLDDCGLLHDAVHALSHGRPRRAEIIARIEALERLVPGYLAR